MSGCIKRLENTLCFTIWDLKSQMKSNNLAHAQSHPVANHHKSKPKPRFYPIKVMCHVGKREIFNTARQYSREIRSSHHTMGVSAVHIHIHWF